jgi:hypothetical protein
MCLLMPTWTLRCHLETLSRMRSFVSTIIVHAESQLTFVVAEIETAEVPAPSASIWSQDSFFETRITGSWTDFLQHLATEDQEQTEPSETANEPLNSSASLPSRDESEPASASAQDIPYGQTKGFCSSRFEQVKAHQTKTGTFPYGPCADEEEWEFVEWAVESGLSQAEIEKLLNLKMVS